MLVFFKELQNPRFRDAVSSLITFVKGVFTNTFDFLSDSFNAIVDLVGGVTDKLGTIFGGDATFKERTDALVGIFGDLGMFIFNIGNSLITNVLEMFGVSFEPYDSAGAYLLGKLKEMWNSITSFFGDLKTLLLMVIIILLIGYLMQQRKVGQTSRHGLQALRVCCRWCN